MKVLAEYGRKVTRDKLTLVTDELYKYPLVRVEYDDEDKSVKVVASKDALVSKRVLNYLMRSHLALVAEEEGVSGVTTDFMIEVRFKPTFAASDFATATNLIWYEYDLGLWGRVLGEDD